jgi:hypothetical protein
MNRIEQELFDLEEHLRRNDDIADNSAYLTIIDIANKVSELDAENAKLRNLAHILCHCMQIHAECDDCRLNGAKGELAFDPLCACDGLHELLRETGIEVG